jgi:hypothetical protein
MSNFHVGQKVAATEDLDCGISKGDVFTISKIEHANFIAYDGEKQSFSLHFVERVVKFGGHDPRFFRPVVTRKTSIKIFTDMLQTQRTGVPA